MSGHTEQLKLNITDIFRMDLRIVQESHPTQSLIAENGKIIDNMGICCVVIININRTRAPD